MNDDRINDLSLVFYLNYFRYYFRPRSSRHFDRHRDLHMKTICGVRKRIAINAIPSSAMAMPAVLPYYKDLHHQVCRSCIAYSNGVRDFVIPHNYLLSLLLLAHSNFLFAWQQQNILPHLHF
jgi:hypothetical protein